MGERGTSCGVSCVCKLDGRENVGRVKLKGRYKSLYHLRWLHFNRAFHGVQFYLHAVMLGDGRNGIYFILERQCWPLLAR